MPYEICGGFPQKHLELEEHFMKTGTLLKTLAGSLAVMGLGVSLAFASADDAIKGRQTCMKSHGKTVGELAKMFKGEAAYDMAAVRAALAEMDATCADWVKWWGPDTQKGETLETWARPEVWTDSDGFNAAAQTFVDKEAVLAATTDVAGFKAAFPEFGNTCKGCHEKFRRPKE